jgi:competence protein ComEC
MQCQICWLAYSMNGVEKVWVLHRPRQTLLMHQAGAALFACSAESGIPDEKLLTGFKLGTRCRKLSTVPLRKAYRWDASSLVVLGANSGWPAPDGRKLYLLMTGSPKFHMGRLLDSLRPAVVVADGSNYPSYVARWKASCEKRKISFHYTGSDGAYCLQIAGN